jgi:hypothetical protein
MFVRFAPAGGGYVDHINLDQVAYVRFLSATLHGTTVRTPRAVSVYFVGAHEPLTLMMTEAQAEEFDRVVRGSGRARQ